MRVPTWSGCGGSWRRSATAPTPWRRGSRSLPQSPPPGRRLQPPAQPQPQPEPAEPQGGASEAPRPKSEAPRLIALNMVLDGASREQVAQYLDENFDLEDPGELLDEVWSSAGG